MESDRIQTFGERLREHQARHDLATNRLAREFAVDPNFIRLLIRGLRFPSKHLLRRFCIAFREPIEKWSAAVRWEREPDPEIKAILTRKILRKWYAGDRGPHPYDPDARLCEPEEGAALPVFGWREARHMLRSIHRSPHGGIADLDPSTVIGVSSQGCFWIRADGEHCASTAIASGDLILVRPCVEWGDPALIEGALLLAPLVDDAPIVRRFHDLGFRVALRAASRPEVGDAPSFFKTEEPRLLRIRYLLKVY